MTRLLVTGFGPFPGAPENPTELLVRALAKEPAEAFGASALKGVVLRTEYRRSWATLRRLYLSFSPDLVVHFGLNGKTHALHLECVARNTVDPGKPDASGYAPRSARLVKGGPDTLASVFPANAIAAALEKAGFSVALSEDAGGYVCNAILYRSLHAAPPKRRVGFVHVPPPSALAQEQLLAAARIILAGTVRG